jgi:outer membrane protein OmpA-like peptidoglycan-associated protein
MMLRAALAALALLVGACAQPTAVPVSPDRVVLLPGSDGTTGAVIVRQGGSEVRIDQAYGSARAGAGGSVEVTRADAAQVRAEFADVLNAMPPAPLSFVVYFVFGQDELTEESRKDLGPVLQDITRRTIPEITVIGHADQAGPERINDTLAIRRAERVKELLVQRGVRSDRIVAVGRGSREPAVRAAEGVAEARNRRVEISVR